MDSKYDTLNHSKMTQCSSVFIFEFINLLKTGAAILDIMIFLGPRYILVHGDSELTWYGYEWNDMQVFVICVIPLASFL